LLINYRQKALHWLKHYYYCLANYELTILLDKNKLVKKQEVYSLLNY
jgi:hypothetical protein